ncbi:serine hydrolase [Holophaga foetida]|uniref:serine hydrolase n=1 Tax=Holophaga foetida TaxID=35839 RepID=UPI0006973464|nr:serine hydrolase [Holophaga foetida]
MKRKLPQPAPQRLVLSSASALVQDQQTGRDLVEKAPDTVLPIASITKLMTVMVILDARQSPDEELLIDRQDLDVLRHSRSRLPLGTRLPRKEALKLALMASENRAANALGHAYPGGLGACVAAMNAKARALGLSHTHYVDPAGLGEGNVSSARDLVQLVRIAYNHYPEIRRDSTYTESELQSGSRYLHFINTSRLVRGGNWEIGLSKTGFIDEAGHCLVMQAKLASRQVFIVLLKAPGKLTHFGDANRIRQWIESRS